MFSKGAANLGEAMSGARAANRRCRLCGILLLCVWMPVSGPALDHLTPPIPEAQLKAAFLYNLPLFVQESDDAKGAASGNTEYRIGILDDSGLRAAFAELVATRQNKRSATLVTIRSIRDAETCNMLFLNGKDAHLIRRILQHVETRPILTVGDDPAFISWGGILRFVTEGDRLSIEASQGNARQAGLRMSAQLLEVCRIVDANPPPAQPSPHKQPGTSTPAGGSP